MSKALNLWTPNEKTVYLPSPRRVVRSHEALHAANALSARICLQEAPASSSDPQGQALRELRIRRDMDPVLLATQACISLRQLLQLESGETSLFYSKSLRNQAGRRVATLLGAQWDTLGQLPPEPEAPPATGVVMSLVPPATRQAREEEAVAGIGKVLHKPATDTLVTPPAETAQMAPPREVPVAKRRGFGWLWSLLGVLACAAAGYAMVTAGVVPFQRFA